MYRTSTLTPFRPIRGRTVRLAQGRGVERYRSLLMRSGFIRAHVSEDSPFDLWVLPPGWRLTSTAERYRSHHFNWDVEGEYQLCDPHGRAMFSTFQCEDDDVLHGRVDGNLYLNPRLYVELEYLAHGLRAHVYDGEQVVHVTQEFGIGQDDTAVLAAQAWLSAVHPEWGDREQCWTSPTT